VIAGSTEAGVVVDTSSDSNTFAGNYVGTDRTDTVRLRQRRRHALPEPAEAATT
jgi:hypothetical protein